jgi:uncharacterized membrane protein YdbT with pleckstrin-like domain
VLAAIAFGISSADIGTTTKIGRTLTIVGGIAFCFVVVWNLVWINWVLFTITLEDNKRNS